jgi:predicted RNA-binding protein with RPS1 domain
MSDQNLSYLQVEYFKNTAAAKAYSNFQKWTDDRLCKVLRHHDEKDISEMETWQRDEFDYLLGFYGIVEIAAMIDFVDEIPLTFRDQHLSILQHPAVRRYYEWNYPLQLPGRLAERLEGISVRRVQPTSDSHGKFLVFLELTRMVEHDDDLESFLWTLDGGWRQDEGGECDIDHLRDALRDPEKFVQALQIPQKDRTELESALNGTYKFIQFCEAFAELITRQRLQQEVAEAMWLYHAYWFRQFDTQIGDNLRGVLKELEKWRMEEAEDLEIDPENTSLAKNRVIEIGEVIKNLSIPPLARWKSEKRNVGLKEKMTGSMSREIEIGQLYQGRVVSIKEFGAFVELLPGKEGLVHISELADFRVKHTEDVVKAGDTVWVKCIAIDEKGRIKLSRKAALKEHVLTRKGSPREVMGNHS